MRRSRRAQAHCCREAGCAGIVVGLGDTSDDRADDGAVEWAVREGRRRGCPVRLVLAWESDVVEAVRHGEEVLARLDERSRRAVRLELYRGSPETVWPHAARGADLLVLAGGRDGAPTPADPRDVACPPVVVCGNRAPRTETATPVPVPD